MRKCTQESAKVTKGKNCTLTDQASPLPTFHLKDRSIVSESLLSHALQRPNKTNNKVHVSDAEKLQKWHARDFSGTKNVMYKWYHKKLTVSAEPHTATYRKCDFTMQSRRKHSTAITIHCHHSRLLTSWALLTHTYCMDGFCLLQRNADLVFCFSIEGKLVWWFSSWHFVDFKPVDSCLHWKGNKMKIAKTW